MDIYNFDCKMGMFFFMVLNCVQIYSILIENKYVLFYFVKQVMDFNKFDQGLVMFYFMV